LLQEAPAAVGRRRGVTFAIGVPAVVQLGAARIVGLLRGKTAGSLKYDRGEYDDGNEAK
jgi:hypothetical protein